MEAIKNEIKRVEMKMEWEQERLDAAVKEFREAAANYDSYSIETFIPGKVAEIANLRARLHNLAEQKDMLEYLLREQEA